MTVGGIVYVWHIIPTIFKPYQIQSTAFSVSRPILFLSFGLTMFIWLKTLLMSAFECGKLSTVIAMSQTSAFGFSSAAFLNLCTSPQNCTVSDVTVHFCRWILFRWDSILSILSAQNPKSSATWIISWSLLCFNVSYTQNSDICWRVLILTGSLSCNSLLRATVKSMHRLRKLFFLYWKLSVLGRILKTVAKVCYIINVVSNWCVLHVKMNSRSGQSAADRL